MLLSAQGLLHSTTTLNLTNKIYGMDKSTRLFISFVAGLLVFALSRDIIFGLIVFSWMFFILFSLPYKLYLLFSVLLIIYYVIFKNINFNYIILTVVFGLLSAIIPESYKGEKNTEVDILRDTKVFSIILLSVFFLLSLFFSYQTYQKRQQTDQDKSEKPVEKVIIQLKNK